MGRVDGDECKKDVRKWRARAREEAVGPVTTTPCTKVSITMDGYHNTHNIQDPSITRVYK